MITQAQLMDHLLRYGSDSELMRRHRFVSPATVEEGEAVEDELWRYAETLNLCLVRRNRPDHSFVFEDLGELFVVVGFEDEAGKPCVVIEYYSEPNMTLGLVHREPSEVRLYASSDN